MRILRIKLRNYRGVEEREVRLAPSGVTVIHGPNEIGKSSLAEAVDFVFKQLDSSTRAELRAAKPVHADEGAEVEVEVESGPYAFTIFKRFHKRQATRLTVSRPRPESLTGREAHERMREILAETVDLELWDALRLEQGTGLAQAELGNQPRLAAALDQAAGEVSAGEREESLVEASRKECERYYTERGKPRKELEDAEQSLDEAQRQLGELAEALERVEQDVERSARLERDIARLRSDEVRLFDELQRRQEEARQLEARKEKLKTLEAEREAAVEREKRAAAELEERARLAEAVNEAEKALRELEEAAEAASPAARAIAGEAARAKAELARARAVEFAATRLRDLRRRDHDALRDGLDLAQLRERRDRIEAATLSAADAERTLQRPRVDAALLKRIEAADLAVRAVEARLAAARASLTIEAVAPIAPLVDGAPLPLEPGERRDLEVESARTLEFPGLARLTLRSGASPVSLASELEKAQNTLRRLCQELEVADLAAARETHEAQREAERTMRRRDEAYRENLRDLSPSQLEAKIRDLALRLESPPARESGDPPPATDLDQAKALLDSAEAATRSAASDRDGAERVCDQTQRNEEQETQRALERAERLRAAREALTRSRAALEKARQARSDEELTQAQAERAARARHCIAACLDARGKLEAADPEHVKERAASAEQAAESAARALRKAELEMRELAGTLRARGEEGLEERRGAAAARCEGLRRGWDSLHARAQAAKLLFETLARKRDEARQRYVAPLRERIEKLGRYVFPGGLAIELGDDLRIQTRTLGGRTVPFEALSAGAQEQLAVITRLACAMVVSADGGVPVILDDALGYSDPRRLEEMAAVLSSAGREAQVIVLTCTPERYRHVAAAQIVDLA